MGGDHYATGVLDIVGTDGEIETYAWNGNPADKESARAVFEERMASGYYLAVVHDAPGKSHQVRTFDEVLEHEKETGTVEAQLNTAIVGG